MNGAHKTERFGDQTGTGVTMHIFWIVGVLAVCLAPGELRAQPIDWRLHLTVAPTTQTLERSEIGTNAPSDNCKTMEKAVHDDTENYNTYCSDYSFKGRLHQCKKLTVRMLRSNQHLFDQAHVCKLWTQKALQENIDVALRSLKNTNVAIQENMGQRRGYGGSRRASSGGFSPKSDSYLQSPAPAYQSAPSPAYVAPTYSCPPGYLVNGQYCN